MNTVSLARVSDGAPSTTESNGRSNLGKPDISIDVREYLAIIWRQKRVISAIVAVVFILAFVVVSSITPRYTAWSLVEISPRQTQVVDFDAVLTGLPSDNETIQTEIKIIQSRKLAQRAINHLNLATDPEFNPSLRADGLITSWRYSLAAWLAGFYQDPQTEVEFAGTDDAADQTGLYGQLILYLAWMISPAGETEELDEGSITLEQVDIVNAFLSKLSVQPEGRSRVVRISFESTDPTTAANVANAIADFYIVAQLEAKFEATKRATTWLNDRVEQLREEVVAKERVIESYRAKSGLLQGGTDTTLTSEQVSELNAQHVLELARLAEAQARLRQANKLLSSPEGIETSIEVLQSPLIRELRSQESLLEREIAELSEEYGDRHPTLLNKRAELRDLQTTIQLEVERVIQGLRNEVAIAQARATSLAASLERVKSEVAQLNQAEIELRALERDANASRTLLETLLQRTKQTTSQESFQQADAGIVSKAVQPREQSFPRTKLVLALSLLLGLMLGVPAAVALEMTDLGMRSADQVSRYMNVKPLGLLPKVSKLGALGKEPYDYILTNPDSAFAEGIRTLYTNLLLTDVVSRPKVILISSALPGEGKTTVSISLARVLGVAGHRVILVDCDLRRPSVHEDLGIERGSGLVDCLTSRVQMDDVIRVDEQSGAHILTAGTSLQKSPERLNSEQMERLLKVLGRRYDMVILDSAPVLAVSDSLFLARLADKTVFLVRWARTRRKAASLALNNLLAAQANIAGALLTFVDVKSHASYGYSDSGTYHGSLKKYYTE